MSAEDADSRAGIRYRRAAPSDRTAVLEVLATANFDRVPSPEMPDLGLDRMFVAERSGWMVGVAGWRVEAPGAGKTTLMAVRPESREGGIGAHLQELRLDALSASGCRTVRTNADRPETVAWYERRFGYRRVGRTAKLHPFGLPEVDHWTTLELDLERWRRERESRRSAPDQGAQRSSGPPEGPPGVAGDPARPAPEPPSRATPATGQRTN